MENKLLKDLKAPMNFGVFLLKPLITIPMLVFLMLFGLAGVGIGYWMIRKANILTNWLFDLKQKNQSASPQSMPIVMITLPQNYWKTYSPYHLN